jgi:hypothetical protein
MSRRPSVLPKGSVTTAQRPMVISNGATTTLQPRAAS